jgi:hypothetical protein
MARNFVERRHAVGRFANDLDAIDLPEQEAQLVPRVLLVVGHNSSQ